MSKKRILTAILILAAVNLYFLIKIIMQNPLANNLRVIFFDVGQGDASLIMAEGTNILIDGGPDKKVIEKLDKYLPLWNRKIDIMVLTHPHSDHVIGLIDVLKKYEAREIWMTGVLHNSPEYLEFLQIVKDKNINVKIAGGDDLNINTPPTPLLRHSGAAGGILTNTKIEILYPLKNLFQQKTDNLNNSSIVLKISYKDKSFLFAGDIEKEAEAELCDAAKENLGKEAVLDANVLKIAHHGSSTSSNDNFLKFVNPEIAVISVGKDNDFGMPSLRVLSRLERMGAKIFRTDTDGDVVIETDGFGVKILD